MQYLCRILTGLIASFIRYNIYNIVEIIIIKKEIIEIKT